MAANRSVTQRGFVIFDEITDLAGAKVRVQESSRAETHAVWIFCQGGSYTGPDTKPEPHLDVEMAKRVRDALDAFIREYEAENG
jgi:hypothetical protein